MDEQMSLTDQTGLAIDEGMKRRTRPKRREFDDRWWQLFTTAMDGRIGKIVHKDGAAISLITVELNGEGLNANKDQVRDALWKMGFRVWIKETLRGHAHNAHWVVAPRPVV